jgi:membrane protease YdiL (CAAX protease family)
MTSRPSSEETARTVSEENSAGIKLRRLVVETDGRLNMVWRLVLYMLSWWVVFFVALIPATVIATSLQWPDLGKNVVLVVFAIPLLIGWTHLYRRRVDRRSWSGIRMPNPKIGVQPLMVGFLTGFLIIAGQYLLDYVFGWVKVVGNEPAGSGLPLTIGLVLLGFVTNAGAGFLEEIGYRGYVLANLGNSLPLWLATLLSAFLFTIVVHFNRLSLLLFLSAMPIAVLFSITRFGTGTIWFAIGLHWAYDGVQNYIFGLGEPPYGHALLHLEATGYLASVNGNDPLQVVFVCAALVIGFLWLQRTKHLNWKSRLDDDGQITPYVINERATQ